MMAEYLLLTTIVMLSDKLYPLWCLLLQQTESDLCRLGTC